MENQTGTDFPSLSQYNRFWMFLHATIRLLPMDYHVFHSQSIWLCLLWSNLPARAPCALYSIENLSQSGILFKASNRRIEKRSKQSNREATIRVKEWQDNKYSEPHQLLVVQVVYFVWDPFRSTIRFAGRVFFFHPQFYSFFANMKLTSCFNVWELTASWNSYFDV